MARVKTILALIATVFIVIFAIQNHAEVVIKFLVWQLTLSQALVIVLTTAIGVIIGLIVGLNSSFKASKNARELNKSQVELHKTMEAKDLENKKLMGQAENLKAQIEQLNQQIQQLQAQGSPVTAQDFNDSVDSLDI